LNFIAFRENQHPYQACVFATYSDTHSATCCFCDLCKSKEPPFHDRRLKTQLSIIMQNNLTREQRVIVETQHPFVSVVAVAGSGKTLTLCARIKYLVSRGVAADKVLVLSFSNKAVQVLRTRLDGAVPSCNVITFHALGMRLVQSHEGAAGSGVKIAKPTQSQKVLLRAIKSVPRTRKHILQSTSIDLRTTSECARLMRFFLATQGSAELEQRLVADPDAGFTNYAKILGALRRIHKRYDQLLKDGGLIDYAGMLRRGRVALGDSPIPTCWLTRCRTWTWDRPSYLVISQRVLLP
jgi:DNA helicase II / ATP-dependent DNA helicase PcrA